MTRSQRLVFLAIAAVIALGAVILLAGGGGDEQSSETSAESTPTAAPAATGTADAEAEATATPEPTRTPRPQPPLVQPGKVTNLRFEQGERVRFRARSDQPDEIHVHGYDIERAVGPDPVLVAFPATITGIFEIEMHGSGEQIAQLRVDP